MKLSGWMHGGINADVLDNYRQPHRFYHTIAHLDEIWSLLVQKGHGDNNALLLATVFHDIVYDPKSATNEEDSKVYFNEVYKGDRQLKQEVTTIILDTKTHQPQTLLSEIFCFADSNILRQQLDKLLEYEHQINVKSIFFAIISLFRRISSTSTLNFN